MLHFFKFEFFFCLENCYTNSSHCIYEIFLLNNRSVFPSDSKITILAISALLSGINQDGVQTQNLLFLIGWSAEQFMEEISS